MPNFQKHSMKTPVKPYLRSSVLEEINSIPTYFILKAQKPTTEPQILYEDDDQINTSFYGTKNTDNRTPKSMVSQNNKEYSSSPTDYQLPTRVPSNYEATKPIQTALSSYQPQQEIIPEYSSHTNEASNGNSQEIDSSTNSYYNQNPTPTKTQSNYQTIKHQEIISIPTKPQVSSYQLKQEKIPEYPSNAYEMRNSQPVLTGNQMKKNTYNQIKKIITNGNDKYNVIPESKDKPDLPV